MSRRAADEGQPQGRMTDTGRMHWFGLGATIIATVASVIGMWVMLQSEIKTSVTSSMSEITFEVRRSTQAVVEIMKDDLHVRKRVLDREIEAMIRNNLLDPQNIIILERKRSHKDDIEKQIEEIDRKWPSGL